MIWDAMTLMWRHNVFQIKMSVQSTMAGVSTSAKIRWGVTSAPATMATLYMKTSMDAKKVGICDIEVNIKFIKALTYWGRDKMAAISQTTFSNAFSWMKMYEFRLRFHWR